MPGKGRWALLTALFISTAASPQANPQLCASCHGPDGNSVTAGTPSIAAQPRTFLENQLILFREELRKSPVMLPVVKGMKDPEIIALAQHFSKLPAKVVSEGAPDPRLAKLGAEKAKQLRCGVCHLSAYQGQNQIPRLAAQREEYLDSEMRAYRDGKRTGGDTIMAAALYGVKDDEIKALAHYLSRLEQRPAKP